MGGWSGGRVAGKADNITNSAQLGLELELSLAKEIKMAICVTNENDSSVPVTGLKPSMLKLSTFF